MNVKYPHIEVEFVGADGNAFAILELVKRAMKEAGVPKAEIDAFFDQAIASDYDNLLRVVMQTVNVS